MLFRSGALDIPPNIIDNGSNFGDKFYIWAEVGEALLAIPFYCVGKIVAFVLPVSVQFKSLLVKAIVSTMNAFFGALLAVVFFRLCRKYSSVRTSLFLTLTLCFGTFLFPYLKTISRDVQLALCLTGSVYFLFSFTGETKQKKTENKKILYAGVFSALGFLVKMVFLLNVFFLSGYVLYLSWRNIEKVKLIALYAFPLIASFLIFFLYNYLRFGNIFETGYHGGTSFTTPLYYGLYGLLLSSGKGFILFAPITIILLWCSKIYFEKHKAEAVLVFSILIANVVLYAKYVAWAGDGSWGPRYLVSIIPLALVPIAIYLEHVSKFVYRIAITLAIVGFFIQVGGVAIYFGNYLRFTVEFPYKKSFEDPEFLEKSHFNPYYSPILGQLRMAKNNFKEHIEGNIPSIVPTAQSSEQRIPLAKAEQQKLLHTFDFWFTYAMYAGFSPVIFLTLFLLGCIIAVLFFLKLLKTMNYVYVDSLLSLNGGVE